MKRIVSGFSFVEILISLVIFSTVMIFVYSILASGRSSWYTADTAIYIQQQARQSLDFMTKELRQSSASIIDSSVPVDGTNYTQITFQTCQGWNATAEAIDWSSNITYSLNAGKQIYRNATDGLSPVLANDIDILGFRRQTANIVEIYIKGSKANVLDRNVSFTLNSQVSLRN